MIDHEDRRAELGLDAEGLISKRCPVCEELMAARTERDGHGTKRYFCEQCGGALGSEAANSFEPPEPFD
jgi:predicted RNA-binding Zn-ribbon protein involved in translation (DUF1610 family)